MHVNIHPSLQHDAKAQKAQELISACVHCGFCLATCPTYQDKQDERDSPRGRIYLISSFLETGDVSASTQLHLDRCLSCRSCETTCPSGMGYGDLLDVGRAMIHQRVKRPKLQSAFRWLLRKTVTKTLLFKTLLRTGQLFRPLLPKALKQQVPAKQKLIVIASNSNKPQRTMLLLDGCVQAAATPNTNRTAILLLAKLGVELKVIGKAGCCGAVNYHLDAQDDGLDDMRRNIDAWWPHVSDKDQMLDDPAAEAIIVSASGCSLMVKDYAKLLEHDPLYAYKAERISSLCKDISEVIAAEDLTKLKFKTAGLKVAVHTPCTLQHGLQQPNIIADILLSAGFDLAETQDKHLCCGSAGTYSILQPEISQRLRERKLQALNCDTPDVIATGNIGCQLQLGKDEGTPTLHWIELLYRHCA